MRAVIQRVLEATVTVEGQTVAQIGPGMCCLIGVETGDDEADVAFMARKLSGLRIFDDDQGRMNRDIEQVDGALLLVSQFTLLADTRKGKRPSYTRAAEPRRAEDLFDRLCDRIEELLPGKVATGRFQTTMEVSLVNHGPVTIIIDSRQR